MHPRHSTSVSLHRAVLTLFAMFGLPFIVGGIASCAGFSGRQAALTTFTLSTLFVIFGCIACSVLLGIRGRVAHRKALADPEFVARSGPPSPALPARAFISALCATLAGAFFLELYTGTNAGETDRAMIAASLFVGTMWLLGAAGSALSRYLLHWQAWQEHLMLVRSNARKLRTHGR